MWKWLTGIFAGLLIACLGQFIRDDLKYFRNGATREEVALVAAKAEAIDKTVAALNAEVLSTLRSLQASVNDLRQEVRDGKARIP